jgi:hypothetical protein
MFGLFRRSAPRPLSDAIRQAIQRDGHTPATFDPAQLQMVESSGRYSDRKVTYFRVFDPTSTAQRQLDIRRYQDFDVFLGLVVRSGHVETDGTVVLTRPVVVRLPSTAPRSQADRALHTDDAHIVRGETGASANVVSTDAAPQAPASEPVR